MPGPDLGLDRRDFLAATGDSCRLLSDLMRLDFDRLRHCIESNLVEATTRASGSYSGRPLAFPLLPEVIGHHGSEPREVSRSIPCPGFEAAFVVKIPKAFDHCLLSGGMRCVHDVYNLPIARGNMFVVRLFLHIIGQRFP